MKNPTEIRIKTHWTAEHYNGISWNLTRERSFDTPEEAIEANRKMSEIYGEHATHVRFRIKKTIVTTEVYEDEV
jgi:hypothetical protein